MKLGENFKTLPPWAKGAVAVGIMAGVGLTAWGIYRAIQNAAAVKGSKKELDALEGTVKTLSQTQKPTLDKYQSQKLANDVFTALDGRWNKSILGNIDDAAIYRAFTNVGNDLDVVNAIKAYDTKTIKSGSYIVADFVGTMTEAITALMNAEQIQALNGILSRKGIKYRF